MHHHKQLAGFVRETWNIRPRSFASLRSVYGVLDQQGHRYILKPVSLRAHAQRLESAAAALQSVYDKGAPVVPWILSSDGKFQCEFAGKWWSMQEWRPGRICNFQKKLEWHEAMKSAAILHRESPDSAFARVLPAPSPYSKYLARLQMARRAIWKSRLPLLEREWETWEKRAFAAIEEFKDGTGSFRKTFCHRDLAPHNILWNHEQAVLIDFDLSGMDDSVHDLYQLCNHRAYCHGWKLDDMLRGIEAYDAVRPLSSQEWNLFLSLCRYPSFITREIYEYSQEKEAAAQGQAEKDPMRRQKAARIEWALSLENSRMQSLKFLGAL